MQVHCLSAKLRFAMADFSFSFDSDNPFAEPEQAPKKASASTEESSAETPDAASVGDDAPAPPVGVAEPAPATDDGFSLDSFDFAFDEGASVNDTLPTQTNPPGVTAPRQLTPGEAAFAEFDFSALEGSEAPNSPITDLESTPEPEVAPEIEIAAEPHSAAEPEFVAETEAPSESEFASELESQPAPQAEFSSAPEFTVESEIAPEAEIQSIEIEPELETESVSKFAVEPEFTAEPEVPTDSEIQPVESELEPLSVEEFATDAESAAEEVQEVEIALEPEVQEVEFTSAIAEPEVESEVIPEPEFEDIAESEVEAIAEPDFDPLAAFEVAAPDESEPFVSVGKSAKASSKTTPSDLEEFNALVFDLNAPADEQLVGETDAAELAPVELSLAELVPVELVSAEDIEVAEMDLVAEEAVAEVEAPAEVPTEVSVPHAVAAAASFASVGSGQTESEFRRLKTKASLSVAILGASGIGKNHARWFHRNGCRVAGFLGTSADSTAQTESELSDNFDFQGNAYTDLETLLKTEKPDIVCVATPPPLHFSHVLQSLEAGAHVLCEKPLVYAPTRKFRENRDGAKELVKVAAKKKLNLGTQLQYGAATPILCKLAGLTPTDVGDFAMELETFNPNSPLDPRELWIDLGPHPISVAQMLAGPDATLAEETIRFEPYQDDDKTEVLARFGINCADGRLLMVRAVVRALRGETTRKPRRRFSFNGHAVTYAPLVSAKNGFQAQFVAPDGYASIYPDPVDYLIGNFVAACRNDRTPIITGDFGRENLEWMLKVGMPDESR